MLFKNYLLSSCTLLSSKNNAYSKDCVIKQLRLFLRLMINYNESENEKSSHMYDINRPRPRHGHTMLLI